jgi:plastocyanin
MGEPNDASEDASDGTPLTWARRPVLKAVGAAGAISGLGGAVTAQEDDGDDGDGDDGDDGDGDDGDEGYDCRQPECIHSYLGFSIFPFEEDPDPPAWPDHRVLVDQRPKEHQAVPGPLEFVFDPVGLHVGPGDVVAFEWTAGHHSVSAYHPTMDRQRRMPVDAAPFSSPMLGSGAVWLYRFETPGVYDIFCPPHEVYGMVMRIVVGDDTETEFGEANPEAGLLPPVEFANVVFDSEGGETDLDDDSVNELSPETIVEEGEIAWDDLFE